MNARFRVQGLGFKFIGYLPGPSLCPLNRGIWSLFRVYTGRMEGLGVYPLFWGVKGYS